MQVGRKPDLILMKDTIGKSKGCKKKCEDPLRQTMARMWLLQPQSKSESRTNPYTTYCFVQTYWEGITTEGEMVI